MKPAGKGRYDSLYFDYPRYRFQAAAEQRGESPLHPVLIAGAGPVGLLAAIALARQGIASVVLDEKDTLNDGSRAICISRHSFETLQQLGVVAPFLAKALPWTSGRSYFRDRFFYRMEMPHSADERFHPMYNLQQQYIEKFLVDAAAGCVGLIDLRWQSRVRSVEQDQGQVRLEVDTPGGSYVLRGRYLLAADGARSQVRSCLGLALQGSNLSGDYVITDIRMRHDFPTERRCFFESSGNPGATILIHRQPDDIWRLDYQLPPGADREMAMEESSIRAAVQRILDMIGHVGDWELEWWSIYTANTLCLDDYRHGRTLFIGDSAHIVPIFGVRGLNNGFEDALNAAWKLAFVLRGWAADALLDSYTPERRGATLDVFANAARSARFMHPPTRGFEIMRRAVLEMAFEEAFCRRFADPRQVQPYTYRDSPLVSVSTGDRESADVPRAGDPLPNRRLGDEDFLLDYLDNGFAVLTFADEPLQGERDGMLGSDNGHVPLRVLRVCREALAPGSIADPQGRLAANFGAVAGSTLLIRPDRYIAARCEATGALSIELALTRALGGEP